MTRRIFVTGTDTEVGKTWVTAQLMRELHRAGYRVQALKPVAAGGVEKSDAGEGNEDALLLQSLCSTTVPYEQVNPFLLQEPVAPHIAAQQQGQLLTVDQCVQGCRPGLDIPADVVVVEGAGGWLVPLNDHETMADLAIALGCSVIIVVGMRLGCINHALLTLTALRAAGVPLEGWVANELMPGMPKLEENIEALASRMGVPLLARFPYESDVDQNFFDVSSLMHSLV